MSRAHRLSLTSLVLCAAVPFAWVACGGSKPKPETPADETAASSSSAASSDESAASAAPAASSAGASDATPAADSATAAAPPAAPPLGGTDCGKCIDKTCAKPEAACGKNGDCQAMIDGFHGCGSDKGAAACLDSATEPSGAKPKKLATAVEACVKKAVAKACKSKCQ